MKRALTAILAATIGLSGCGTMIFRNSQRVTITTNVENALIEGHGQVPGTVDLDRDTDHALLVQAPGYEPETVRVHSRRSWWRVALSVALNGALGVAAAPGEVLVSPFLVSFALNGELGDFWLWVPGVVGCTVDAGSGAWDVLEEDEVHADLQRSRPRAEPREPGVSLLVGVHSGGDCGGPTAR